MVVHRGEIDVRFRHNVAQRHVAKTAIGIQPFSGGENRRSGLIAGHGLRPFVIPGQPAGLNPESGGCGARFSDAPLRIVVRGCAAPRNDGCISNICMKLSFEGPEMSIREPRLLANMTLR